MQSQQAYRFNEFYFIHRLQYHRAFLCGAGQFIPAYSGYPYAIKLSQYFINHIWQQQPAGPPFETVIFQLLPGFITHVI